MKRFLRTLLIGVAVFNVGPVKAFVVGDLDYYGLGNNQCRVVGMVSTAESLDLVIPQSIWFNEIRYSVVEVASGVFTGNTQLKSVSIPSTIQSLPRNSFANCVNLTSIRIEDGDDYIAIHENDFEGCPLSSIYVGRDLGYFINNTTGEYEASPFCNLTSLKNIEFGTQVTYLRNGFFKGDTSVEKVKIPSNIVDIFGEAFSGCTSLKDVIFEDGVVGKLAVYAFDGVFQDCPITNLYMGRNLGQWYIDDTFTEISPSPFRNMTTLTNLQFGQPITGLPHEGFKGCTSLEKVSIPGGVEDMLDGVFEGCTSLKEVIFEDGEGYIYPYNPNERTFYGCPIEKLYVGRNMGFWYLNEEKTLVTNSLFRNMSTLKDLQFGPGATDLRSNMFEGCTGLTTLTLPPTIKALFDKCFKGCTNMKKVIVEDSEDYIAIWEDAFIGTPVESLYMGRDTGHWAEEQMDSENGVYNGFQNVHTLVDLTFGPLVKIVDFHAFEGCTGLTSLTLPDNIEEVWAYAFKGCTSLVNLNFGSGMKSIGKEAFAGCNNLKVVSNKAVVPPLAEESAFSETAYSQARLEVYKDAFNIYKSTSPWSYFTQIEGIENVGVERVKDASNNVDIFNLQGVCVKANASQSDIDALRPGIYIIGGKKVVVK